MILFSKTGSKGELMADVGRLEDSTLPACVVRAALSAVQAMLSESKEETVSISVRVNTVPSIGASQIEIQLSERKISK